MSDRDTSQGVDLIFLSELPIGTLPDRSGDSPQTLTFELPARPGKRERRQCVIDAAASLGLPTLVDVQIFICLMAYTREHGFPERVPFCRHWIIRDLGWDRSQRAYDRVKLALDRLQRTSYVAINHYPDPKGKGYLKSRAFHLLKEYKLYAEEAEGERSSPGWFTWSEDVRQFLQTRVMKQLDFAFFRGLENPLAQAAYRYLHTRRLDGKPVYEEDLVEYACERLGLSRNFRWPSELKRTLDPVHAELIEKGFLESVSYERQKREKGQKVVFSFPETQPAPGVVHPRCAGYPLLSPPAAPPVVDDTLEALVAAGITRGAAEELVAEQREECARQLSYLPYRTGLQHPAGALRRAIEEAWPAPDAWQQAQRKRRPARRTPAAPQAPTPAPDPAAAAAAFAAWWSALPEAERAAIDQAVAAELPDPASAGGRHLARHPAARARLCRELRLQLRGSADHAAGGAAGGASGRDHVRHPD